jgi:hypothetical protein
MCIFIPEILSTSRIYSKTDYARSFTSSLHRRLPKLLRGTLITTTSSTSTTSALRHHSLQSVFSSEPLSMTIAVEICDIFMRGYLSRYTYANISFHVIQFLRQISSCSAVTYFQISGGLLLVIYGRSSVVVKDAV